MKVVEILLPGEIVTKWYFPVFAYDYAVRMKQLNGRKAQTVCLLIALLQLAALALYAYRGDWSLVAILNVALLVWEIARFVAHRKRARDAEILRAWAANWVPNARLVDNDQLATLYDHMPSLP